MFKAQHISIRKGGRQILDSVDLSFSAGEVLAVVGPNGAGKSTLLRALVGEEQLDAGKLLINEHSVQNWEAGELARIRAVLHQKIQLAVELSVLETVVLGRYPYRRTENLAQRRRVAYQLLEEVGMSAFAQRNIQTLSGGEQQRVHFARVLAQLQVRDDRERFLLLDEPLASLDISQQVQLLRLLRRVVRQSGYGILIIMHDLNLAAQFADRVLLLDKGKVAAYGRPSEVFSEERIRAVYGVDVRITQAPETGAVAIQLDADLDVAEINPSTNPKNRNYVRTC